jgi:hypothetical protein
MKQKFPHMTYVQNFQHIIKYKLPSSIQSSPRWHESQFTRSINLECFIFKNFNCIWDDNTKMARN